MVRTTSTVLALAAVLASCQAAVHFDISSCGSSTEWAIDTSLSASNAVSDDWACFTTPVAADSQLTFPVQWPQEWHGLSLQVVVYNYQREIPDAGDASDLRWRTTAATPVQLVTPQLGQSDLAGLDLTDAANVRARDPWTWVQRDAAQRLPSGASINFVYSYSADTVPNPGVNTLWLSNVNPAGSSRQRFAVVWRIVTAPSPAHPERLPVATSAVQADLDSPVGVAGSATHTTVNALQPGGTFSFQLGDEFATVGYAVQGLQLSATVSAPTAVLPQSAWAVSLPTGWAQSSLNGSMVIPTPQASSHPQSYQFHRNYMTSVSHTNNVITANWSIPLDFVGTALAPEDKGIVTVTIPPLTDLTSYNLDYDWSSFGPFWDVTVTVDGVIEYPLLASSDPADAGRLFTGPLRLLNADPVYTAQFNTTTTTGFGGPTEQQVREGNTPFGVFMVKTDATWWSAGLTFTDVENLNKPVHLPREPPPPGACTPLWEVQPVYDYTAGGSSHPSGPSQTWGASGVVEYVSFADATPSADATFRDRTLVQPFWWDATANTVPAEGALLAASSPSRPLYFFVRVGAVPDTLYREPGAPVCGSSNITMAGVSWTTRSALGQCSGPAACMPERFDDHPAKGKQMGESANADDIDAFTRFSSCVVSSTLSSGQRVPTTLCAECTADSHCKEGQFCWIDDGLCTQGSTGRQTWYVCDAPSRDRRGVCRDKSPEVLGQQCGNGLSYYDAARNPLPGLLPAVAGVPPPNLVKRGTADNEDVVAETLGACGEYRFYNSSPPLSALLSLASGAAPDGSGGWASLDGQVRVPLWEGSCLAGTCVECVSGDPVTTGPDTRVCLNGRLRDKVDVDGTLNTGRVNTRVGVNATHLVMWFALAVTVACFSSQAASRWRTGHGRSPLTTLDWCTCGAFSVGKPLPQAPVEEAPEGDVEEAGGPKEGAAAGEEESKEGAEGGQADAAPAATVEVAEGSGDEGGDAQEEEGGDEEAQEEEEGPAAENAPLVPAEE